MSKGWSYNDQLESKQPENTAIATGAARFAGNFRNLRDKEAIMLTAARGHGADALAPL